LLGRCTYEDIIEVARLYVHDRSRRHNMGSPSTDSVKRYGTRNMRGRKMREIENMESRHCINTWQCTAPTLKTVAVSHLSHLALC